MTWRRWGAGIAASCVCGALAGCARPVAVTPAQLDSEVAAACAQLMAALPSELADVGARRKVTPASSATAAWGDPPVLLRCGVPVPAALEAQSLLVTVDSVDWFGEQLTGGYLLTTVGRVLNIELTVPTAHGPAPEVATEFATVVRKLDPLASPLS